MFLHLIADPVKYAILGPASWYRLHRNTLVEGPSGRILAEHSGGCWKADDLELKSILCNGPALCHFEDGNDDRDAGVHGPFEMLTLMGEMLWGDEFALARLDGRNSVWHVLHSGGQFAAVSFRSAPEEPEGS